MRSTQIGGAEVRPVTCANVACGRFGAGAGAEDDQGRRTAGMPALSWAYVRGRVRVLVLVLASAHERVQSTGDAEMYDAPWMPPRVPEASAGRANVLRGFWPWCACDRHRRRRSQGFERAGEGRDTILVLRGTPAPSREYVINATVQTLGHFATEVTRVSRDVGTDHEGKLGAQAHVEDVEGTWRELTDVGNQGKLGGEATVLDVEGVWFELATIQAEGEINTLKDSQSDGGSGAVFASQVTRVAVEGKLGGQAKVEGVQGTWKDPTDNVNTMASNLAWQVRSILEVTNGDLGRTMEGSSLSFNSPFSNTLKNLQLNAELTEFAMQDCEQ
ncbi:hypothetical protein C8F04DRAFT_1273248 [Mycena alexandri]|uniref:Uncharacterized protein n=1 Tax=Mycena alexandri TaxID=1745969 RepID=A0AAD6SAA4_9AGAR|nr:hypothetical protein C8F04DRAFT_1273248 [Mycena alexandri]